ncbi:uncharacterized protein LOC128245917 [Mya arenaria]|uniref:uncharacterized protein LOC128245917 n=1 Tax=Mya arenaria TaxID=6604 RepID=UPI0022DEA9CB|nr:uncharacterized protein LOC128245917 [Mya arenaria]
MAVLMVTVAGRALESNAPGDEHMQNDGVNMLDEERRRKYSGPGLCCLRINGYFFIKNQICLFISNRSVHHFARHGLCNHRFGKVKFFRALGKHFHNISDDMKITFVLDICKRRDQMLTKWVQEIFDKDGDGYITHFEMEIYE